MKNFKSIVLMVLILGMFSGCTSKDKEKTSAAFTPIPVVIPDGLINTRCEGLEALKSAEKKIVYYFDGDCAFCFGRLRALEAMSKGELGNIAVINIASTHDYPIFNFNLKSSKVQSCVLVDTVDAFYKSNDEFLLNQIGLLNEQNEVIYVGDLLENESIKEEFKKLLGL